MTGFRTLDQADLKGKRVLLRVDLNVPMENGCVSDATRIERHAPTITEIADRGGKVILLSHFGRPKGRDPNQSLRPVAAEVAKISGRPVAFAEDCVGPAAEAAIARMRDGDILCLENTRFYKEEEANDPAFARKLAALGDVFVNDAFSAAHRAHASTTGIVTESKLPAYAGRAMQAELEALTHALETPARPVAAIVGGAKVSSKLDLLGNLLAKVDVLIIGGGMANTFLAALGKPIGTSLAERELVPTARDIMDKAKSLGREIILPLDVVVAQKFEAHAPSKVVDVDQVGANDMILDIGPHSIEHVVSALARAKTLVWNGPFGAFEKSRSTTARSRWPKQPPSSRRRASSFRSPAAAIRGCAQCRRVTDRFTLCVGGGGAFLEWLEGKVLPGVEVLRAQSGHGTERQRQTRAVGTA
jgi:phosphoglycerate kinase